MDANTYNQMSVILWTVTLVAGVATVVVYALQLRVMHRSIKEQNLAWLIQYLQSPEVRSARDVVLGQLKNLPYNDGDGWSRDEQKYAATACAAYNIAGVLVQLRRVDADVILENWGPSIVGVKEICDGLIVDRRKESGKVYWKAFTWLYEQAKQRYKRAGD